METFFRIIKLETNDHQRMMGLLLQPPVPDTVRVVIWTKGRVGCFTDFDTRELQAPFVLFATPGKPFQVIPSDRCENCDLWYLQFRLEAVAEHNFRDYVPFLTQSDLQLIPGRGTERMGILCTLLEDEMLQGVPDYSVVRHTLTTLLAVIASERKQMAAEPHGRGTRNDQVFTRFLQLLEDHFREEHGVDFYAGKLCMSVRNLNHISQRVMKRSISDLIEARKLTEARSLLLNSSKTVSEIGFEVGYTDKAYFTTVFKKRNGLTPTGFRERMLKLFA